MPLVNALLVRWANGWSEVTDAASIAAHGRHEALLGLGAVQTRSEMERVAQQQLAIYAEPRVEITADVAPADETDTPYLAYLVGDTLLVPGMDGTPSRERVLALTVAEDDNGQITYAPDLRNVLLSQNERIEQAIKKMADGTLRGDSKVATPVSQISANTSKDCCPPTPPAWSIRSGPPQVNRFNPWSELWASDTTERLIAMTVSGEVMYPHDTARIELVWDHDGSWELIGTVDLGEGSPQTIELDHTLTVGEVLGFHFPDSTNPEQTVSNVDVKATGTGQHDNVILSWSISS